MLYVLSAKPPLHVYAAKQSLLFSRSLTAHPRLVSEVVSGVGSVLEGPTGRGLTCHRVLEVAGLFDHNPRLLYR